MRLPRRKIRTVHNVGKRDGPLGVDNYDLVKTELVGRGIIQVEFEFYEIGQKAINTQSLEIDSLVRFSGSWVEAQY